MARKIILLADPGIDTAFALTLALRDPELDVLAVAASAGNVSAEQATRNVHILVEQADPPRWPRIGAAVPANYDLDGRQLHGPEGLGSLSLPSVQLHHPHPSDKLIIDLVRQSPHEVTIITLGPLTVLARALDRDAELAALIQRLVCVGGTWHEPGDAGPVSEFHIACDPLSAQRVIRAGLPMTLVPLDVTRKLIFSPKDLLELPSSDSNVGQFLRQIVPFGIGASSNLYGIEGFHLLDVLGVAALRLPGAVSTKQVSIDIETRGELTRGMTVVDTRPGTQSALKVDLAVGVDVPAVRAYMQLMLGAGE